MAAEAIPTRHLFRDLATDLIDLLRELPGDRWSRRTCYPTWTVHDIAAHLIQTGLSRLSERRDDFRGTSAMAREQQFETLSDMIDAANSRWTALLSSLSPRVLVDLLALSEFQLVEYFEETRPLPALSSGVLWAGEHESDLWFDAAREFTERWHHQQQIREAVDAPGIQHPRYLKPVLETLLRAVPHWYQAIEVAEGSLLEVHVVGESGGRWQFAYGDGRWARVAARAAARADASVTMSQDTAWRFLTRTMTAEQAEPLIEFSGDPMVSRNFLNVVAVMMPKALR